MPPKTNPLDKKPPVNPKYANVETKLNSGATVDQKKMMSAQAVAQRRNEIFKRVKCSTLARLIQENEVAESVFGLVDDNKDVRDNASSATAGTIPQSNAPSAVPTVAGSVVSVVATDADTVDGSKDHVIYDLREADDYNSHHISSALSYPATLLNRDKISPELYKLKSSPKLLIVYHTNEALGAPVATQLVQKGWENTYMVSGGLDEFAQSYPELVDGEIPDRPRTGASAVSKAGSRR
jgi:centrosomal protein CEP41